jgi:signal transduction histidine kinase
MVKSADDTIMDRMRRAAARASEISQGKGCLILAVADGSVHDIRLRSAAGFARPDDAREAARSLLAVARETLPTLEARQLPADPSALHWAAGGLMLLPLHYDGEVHGVLACGLPEDAAAANPEGLAQIAEILSLELDRTRLLERCKDLEGQANSREAEDDEKNEEVLKLSEALFAQDIELLRNNEKLGKIEELKNDFIEKMSCELRTPLNSIIEAIISVLTGEDAALSSSAKAALRSALDDGTAFLRTLQNILDLWKIKQGELPVEITDVNLRELVDEAIFSAQDTIGSKPLTVTPRFSDNFPRIRADLAKVNQVLFLLLDNAAKFTERGEIEIEARLDESPSGVDLRCSVKDTGVGICADDQALVFDEFFQVDEPSSGKYRGAGLGLALVRDLVTLLEGEIWIQSDVGHGTTVGFKIPVALA